MRARRKLYRAQAAVAGEQAKVMKVARKELAEERREELLNEPPNPARPWYRQKTVKQAIEVLLDRP